ncbi:hypothetical protein DFR27_0372 [Umboniibacter marinipuniceus]|uniref:FTP domain-containing protein n=2 Tax=Umboniibacter marinipuniceus TaxID=569599 RepID=A0A3M0AB74_9GAMM|nr:hypothetical protein DFR27_0372 [Umboniibacter marinipuniceus]
MKFFHISVMLLILTMSQGGLANDFKTIQQQLSEAYRFDFLDVREQYQLTRFNLRGIQPRALSDQADFSGVDFLRQFPSLSQETPLFQLSELSTTHHQDRIHQQYATTHLSIPVRGSDIRIHRDSSGRLGSINGQSVAISPRLAGFASQWGSEAELDQSRVSAPQLLSYAAAELDIPSRFMTVTRSQTEWVNEAPNLRQTFDVTVGGNNMRVLLEFDAITGDLLKVDNRIHLHQPVDKMVGYQ